MLTLTRPYTSVLLVILYCLRFELIFTNFEEIKWNKSTLIRKVQWGCSIKLENAGLGYHIKAECFPVHI